MESPEGKANAAKCYRNQLSAKVSKRNLSATRARKPEDIRGQACGSMSNTSSFGKGKTVVFVEDDGGHSFGHTSSEEDSALVVVRRSRLHEWTAR